MNKFKIVIAALLLAICISQGLEAKASNIVIVLDPGHGGRDGGASRTWNGVTYKESDIVLKLAKYTRNELRTYAGVTVHMTRTRDVAVGLTERVEYAKSVGATVIISQHINSTPQHQTTASGALVFGPSGNYRAAQMRETRNLSNAILKGLSDIGMKNNGYVTNLSRVGNKYPNGRTADYYSIVRNSVLANIPGMIVEHGFVSNPADCRTYYASNAKIRRMAIAEATAIANYYGLKKKDLSGWYTENGQWYYQNSEGIRAKSGWLTVGKDKFYLDSKGYRVTKWKRIGGQRYYFRKNNGKMMTGQMKQGGKMYWFHKNGQLRTGFIKKAGGINMYANAKGELQTGWYTRKGNLYYFAKNNHGIGLRERWFKRGGKWYYFNKDGYAYKNQRVKINGKQYRFDSNGVCTNRK